jgi:hypothetical protein
VCNIQKGNMGVEINFYMGINDEKGKSHEDYVELRILYFIRVLGAPSYEGDILGELVKCKTSKIYPTTKAPVSPDISGPLAGFQRLWPNMSNPQGRHVRPLSLILG